MLDALKQDKTKQAVPPAGTLKVELHTYQKCALAWMLEMESRRTGIRGGLLAGVLQTQTGRLVLAAEERVH